MKKLEILEESYDVVIYGATSSGISGTDILVDLKLKSMKMLIF
ncbi:hypothetical protein [Cecembia rubra]|nr:hypothetical protein [Cecembia rubra]